MDDTSYRLANPASLRNALDAQGVDVLIASTPEGVTYLSGYRETSHWARRNTEVYAVQARTRLDDVRLVAPASGADLIPASCIGPDRAYLYGTYPLVHRAGTHLDDECAVYSDLLSRLPLEPRTPSTALIECLHSLSRPADFTLAIERRGMLRATEHALTMAFPSAKIIDADDTLRAARAIKSAPEVRSLRAASEITEAAMRDAAEQARVGMSELQVQARLHQSMARALSTPAVTVVLAGPRSSLPSGRAGPNQIREGSVLRMDGGCRYRHYVADIARTSVYGKPTRAMAMEYEALWLGVQAAYEALQPGITGGELFDIQMRTVRRNGIPDYQRLHCGHGIGLANYDLPRITPGSQDIVVPGMVICLETPYYKLGEYGLQVEDTFLVTDSGAERFTTQPSELVTIPV